MATLNAINDFDKSSYDLQNLEYTECKAGDCTSQKFDLQRKANNLVQRCSECGQFIKHVPKQQNIGKNRGGASNHTPRQVAENRGFDTPRCFFCRRTKEQLPDMQTLETDHIKERKNEGGEDRLDNLQILCTACHKLKNHQRLYHNWHVNGEPEGETQ